MRFLVVLIVRLALTAVAETVSLSPVEISAAGGGDAAENPFKQDGDSSTECYG
jgi:hypothetical protein